MPPGCSIPWGWVVENEKGVPGFSERFFNGRLK